MAGSPCEVHPNTEDLGKPASAVWAQRAAWFQLSTVRTHLQAPQRGRVQPRVRVRLESPSLSGRSLQVGRPSLPHPLPSQFAETGMLGLRPGMCFLERIVPDKTPSCSRKAPGLSPGFSERHQEGRVSGGRICGEAREGRASPSPIPSPFFSFFCFQISAGSWCKPPSSHQAALQLSHLPAHASCLYLCWLPWRPKCGLEWSLTHPVGRWNRARCIFKAGHHEKSPLPWSLGPCFRDWFTNAKQLNTEPLAWP